MKRRIVGVAAVSVFLFARIATLPAFAAEGGYCVVVSQPTHDDALWQPVVKALVDKHAAVVLRYEKNVDEVLPDLKKHYPRYVCFVARPTEATRGFVAQVHRLTRRLNDDPYADVIWGILTGYDAENALRIAKRKEPLVIHRTAAGTDIALGACDAGVCYSELSAGKIVRKEPGQEPREEKGSPDSTEALIKALTDFKADLFVTSGHATERDWQIGYSYRNGQFRSRAGQLFGVDLKGNRIPIQSDNPKVYLAVGNCLMGHIDGPDAMALAFLNSGGVDQMAGYTVLTWYGYAGWGLLDYFVEQPGRFTLAEAFFANDNALIHRLETYFPGINMDNFDEAKRKLKGELPAEAQAAGLTWKDAEGLLYDRDALALYGDPAWSAKMAPGPLAWEQQFIEDDGVPTLKVKPLLGGKTFAPINNNGSQRGGRPIFQLLPHRVDAARMKIIQGEDLCPILTDNFLLIPNPGKCDPKRDYRVILAPRP